MSTDSGTNQRSKEHTGIVIFTNFEYSNPLRAIVLDLDLLEQTSQYVLKNVSADTHEVIAYIADPIERKNQERRLAAPLTYGNHITWDDDLVDEDKLIKSFKRAYSTLESRLVDGNGQILLEGLINPHRPDSFYTSYFDYIQLPYNLQEEASPNIYLEAWISCNVDYRGHQPHLAIAFNSFKGICGLVKQIDVGTAPWNIGKMCLQNFAVADYVDADPFDDFIISPPDVKPESFLELCDMEAYLTGSHSFIIVEHPLLKCIMPLLLKTIQWKIGQKYIVSCFYNAYENTHMIYDARPHPTGDVLQTDTASGLIACNVNMHPTFRGVFDSEIFGLVDDPNGILKYLHLTKYLDRPFTVSLYDEQPSCNKQFRFSIYNFVDSVKATKYKDFLRDHEIAESTIYGVVVEKGVVSSEHMPIKFLFGKEDNPPQLGAHIIFDAIYDSHTEHFNIISWQMDPEKQPLHVVKKQLPTEITYSEHKQTLYLVTANVVCLSLSEKQNESNKILYCEEFGVLDDPLNCAPIADDVLTYDVWVKATKREDYYPCRARTAYHVVARGKDGVVDAFGSASILTDAERAQVDLQEQVSKLTKNAGINEEAEPVLTPDDNVIPVPEEHTNNDISNDLLSAQNDGSPVPEHPYSLDNEDLYKSAGKYPKEDDGISVKASAFPSLSNFAHELPGSATFFSSGDRLKSSHPGTDGVEPVTVTTEPPSVIPTNSGQGASNSSADTVQSLPTEFGGIDPGRHLHYNRPVEPYTGPVLDLAKINGKYDIVETLARLKNSFRHGRCGNVCDPKCPWLMKLAELIVTQPDFFEELKQSDDLHEAIKKSFGVKL